MAIIVAMLMVCAGCSEKENQPTPTDVTKQFLTAIQKQDETALKTSSQWNLASMKSLQMQDEDYIDGIDHELQKAAHDTMYGFQFTIKKETIKDKNAQVAIILKTKDIRNAVKKGMKEAEKKVEKLSKDKNFSDQKAQQEILTTLYTYIRDSKEEKELEHVCKLLSVGGASHFSGEGRNGFKTRSRPAAPRRL